MVSHKIPLIIFILWVLILVMQSQFTAAGLSYSNKKQDNRKRSSYNGYFSFCECFSDYECDYGRECDSDGFCIPVEGSEG